MTKIFLNLIKQILVFIAGLVLVGSLWLTFKLRQPLLSGNEPAFFEVEKGWQVQRIAEELKKNGLNPNKLAFLTAYRLYFSDSTLKAGEYEILPGMTIKELLRKMAAGKCFLMPLTIPEGLDLDDIHNHLQKNFPNQAVEFQLAAKNTSLISDLDPIAKDLEGYLFPETYYLPRKASGQELVQAMVSQFRRIFEGNKRQQANELRMTVREVVILASLIEKETAVKEEKPLVSAVFHNRMRMGMKLDCDPTVVYALKKDDRYLGRLLIKDLTYPSPYNTYLYAGLPPGPICSPGLDSIEAALNPAPEKYIYFVSQNDGRHHFSSSYDEHLRAVRKYRLK